MRWTRGGRSGDLEDMRGRGGIGRTGMRFGLGGTLVLLALSLVFGKDFLSLANQVAGGADPNAGSAGQPGPAQPASPEQEKLVDFVSFVLDDVQKTWPTVLPEAGAQYSSAKLVLFTDQVRSGCGFAEAAMGPFYCPADQKVYIDLGFYNELKTRFGAPGDFAQAYVIAHEIGHHVQNLLGTERKLRRMQSDDPSGANALSVRMELQADCYAGVWAHSTSQRNILEAGDVEEGLAAAAAVGDDRIQQQAGGRVNPERWTHGSSAQRMQWFKRGFESGKVSACDTFEASHI